MSSELFVPLGRVSRRVKNLMRFGLACGVVYIVLIACKPFPLNTMYYGFMVEVAERTMLPACLVLFCMGPRGSIPLNVSVAIRLTNSV